jgi:hypothetical protein
MQQTEAITKAQADGHVPRTFTPEDLLTFVLALASAWTPDSAMTPGGMDESRLRSHRGAVVEAVRRLVSLAAD